MRPVAIQCPRPHCEQCTSLPDALLPKHARQSCSLQSSSSGPRTLSLLILGPWVFGEAGLDHLPLPTLALSTLPTRKSNFGA